MAPAGVTEKEHRIGLKYCMYGFNAIVLALASFLVVGVAITTKSSLGIQLPSLGEDVAFAFITPVSLSCVTILLATLGIVAAKKEHFSLTLSYCGLLIVVMILEIFSAVHLTSMAEGYGLSDVESRIERAMTYPSPYSDYVQSTFKCCGFENYTSWNKFYPDGRLPDSCCPPGTRECSINLAGPNQTFYMEPCFTDQNLKGAISSTIGPMLAVVLTAAFIKIPGMVLGAIFAFTMTQAGQTKWAKVQMEFWRMGAFGSSAVPYSVFPDIPKEKDTA